MFTLRENLQKGHTFLIIPTCLSKVTLRLQCLFVYSTYEFIPTAFNNIIDL